MLHENLEEVSVKQLKKKVEEAVAMDLKPYNAFLDQQMMVILKQMEKPSKIYDYLYLVIRQKCASLEKRILRVIDFIYTWIGDCILIFLLEAVEKLLTPM